MKTVDKKLIVIAGPTAVGKTAVAITLAKTLGSEIISADSRQLFKELTIGTAKPTEIELKAVKHHFINSHSINQDYDAAQYGKDALALIHQLFEKHEHVILCGGSGLYIKAVTDGFDEIPEVPAEIRQRLITKYEECGISWLQSKMQEVDPDHFMSIDTNNPHRLIRALEVKLGTGESIAVFQKKKKIEHNFTVINIGLEVPREELYQKIDTRMDSMIRDGLFDEARQLYPLRHHNALQTVGYQEIFVNMEGGYDRAETIRLLKRNSRRYAKRQLTWFKRDAERVWFHPDEVDKMLALIRSKERSNQKEQPTA